ISPAYYFVGYSYHLGMLHTFGISDEQFSLSIESTYAMSYMALSVPILELVQYPIKNFSFCFSLLLLSILYIFILFLIFLTKYENKIEETFIKTKNSIKTNKYLLSAFITLGGSLTVYIVYSMILFICLIWILPLLIGYSKGEE